MLLILAEIIHVSTIIGPLLSLTLLRTALEYHLHVGLQLIHRVLSLMKTSEQLIEVKHTVLGSLLLIFEVLPLVERILSLRSLPVISILLLLLIILIALKVGIIRHPRQSLVGLIVSLRPVPLLLRRKLIAISIIVLKSYSGSLLSLHLIPITIKPNIDLSSSHHEHISVAIHANIHSTALQKYTIAITIHCQYQVGVRNSHRITISCNIETAMLIFYTLLRIIVKYVHATQTNIIQ